MAVSGIAVIASESRWRQIRPRPGDATTAAAAGVPLNRIAAQIRHKGSLRPHKPLHPPLDALSTTSSRDLGL